MARKNTQPARPTEEQLAAVRTMTPPTLIAYVSENAWRNGSARGLHVYVLEMRLDREETYGPQYTFTGRVLSETGRPPSGAREPASCAGVSWAALTECIVSGKIKVQS